MKVERFLIRRWALAVTLVSAVVAPAPEAAWASPVSYTLILSKASGSIGGTPFNDSVLQLQYTLSDSALLTNFSGGTPSNGAFVRSPAFTGDQLSFTITGGGLPSPISGSYTSADSFVVGASTAIFTGGLFFTSASLTPYFSFQVPGAVPSPIPTLDRLSQPVSLTRNLSPNTGGTNNTQDPSGSGIYVGGAAIDNGSSFATTAGTLTFPQAQTRYNGSWTTAAVPEPSTYAMALAGLACGGYSMWRRRKRA